MAKAKAVGTTDEGDTSEATALPAVGVATKRAAEDIAANLGGQIKTKFDPISILTILMTFLPALLQLFQNCKQPTPTGEFAAIADAGEEDTAKSFVAEHFDGNSYDWAVYLPARAQARKAARACGHKLTVQEAGVVAIATLDKIRRADEAEVQAVCGECGAV